MDLTTPAAAVRPQAGRFGLFLTPSAEDYPQLVRLVQAAERTGLDLVGIQDHPYQPAFLDTFALIGDLLARTERLRFFPDVASLPLRPPAGLAKLAASLDVMSGGRFELGIGAGGFWAAVAAMGGPDRTPGQSVEALEEAITLIRHAWSGDGPVELTGSHYQAGGYRPGPPPAHAVGIWVGAYKPRMLRLTGRLADGWVPSLPYTPLEDLPAMRAEIDRAAERAGRDPRVIRRIFNVVGQITDGPTRGLLHGPVEHWVETLVHFAQEHEFDDFVLAPAGADPLGQVELFAEEVAPRVRDALLGPTAGGDRGATAGDRLTG